MADDLRSSLEAAVAEVETAASTDAAASTAPATTPAPAPEQKPTFDAATGKEVVEDKAPTGNPDGVVPASEPKNGENPDEPAEGEDPLKAKPVSGAERAPQSWKPAAKAKWDKMDPEVRQEVLRREREITKTLSETSQVRRFSDGFKKTVEPYMGRFRSANVPPERAIANLLHVDNTLATAPAEKRAELMAHLIKDYGIDVTMLDAALSGAGVQADPVSSRLEQLLEQRLAPLTSFVQQSEQQRQNAIQRDFEQQKTTVESMASDPKFPLFELVREDMADLIEVYAKRGVDVSLSDAYNRAVQMNPEASAQVKESTKREQALAANARTQRALGASLSVTGAPAALKTGVNPGDLRATLEAAVLANAGR